MTEQEAQIKQLQALNELLADHGKVQTDIIKQLKLTIVVVSICFAIIICTMVCSFFWRESQYGTTTTETTTTTLSTEGENAEINNVTNGDMYNDSSTHNE